MIALKETIDAIKAQSREIKSLVLLGVILVFLNFVFNEPMLGIYGVICAIVAAVFLIADHMKGPTIRFGPNDKFRAYSQVVKIIGNSISFLKAIDLYPGLDTLSALRAAPEDVPVQFLTLPQNAWKEKEAFLAAAKRLLSERGMTEIRVADKSVFHDRWILTKPTGFHLTQSIEHIGNKIGAIIEMSVDETNEIVKDFDEYWENSEPLAV